MQNTFFYNTSYKLVRKIFFSERENLSLPQLKNYKQASFLSTFFVLHSKLTRWDTSIQTFYFSKL